jgi:hypothetical protein
VDQAFTIYTRNGKGNKPKGPAISMDLATKDQAISNDLTGKTKTKQLHLLDSCKPQGSSKTLKTKKSSYDELEQEIEQLSESG